MTASDNELVARVVLHDDRAAYGELVQRHQSAVRRFLRHLTNGDAALVRTAEREPLPDDGFTARVTAALPPSRRGLSSFRRDSIIGLVALALLLVGAFGGASAELSGLANQAAGATVNLLHGLLDEPAALTVVVLTVAALLLTESDETPWRAHPKN